ncbi:hypothetical protein [Hymenobacter sp. APR13]|uniref:hypothetical protein n=1 Tax=Hymenobacter sp. APR13 TaxID=1356852 RepID=UPI0004E08153|nr:hypothetical protein [Hymenobacter sp. APR13]AII50926.1 hypothetical protein N008_02880 [Hymenobacter sp. APR13]
MKWLPSFTMLFLLAIAGFVLYMGSTIWSFEHMGQQSPFMYQLTGALGIIGLALTVLAPLLMALRFFMRLDSKV